MLNLPASLQLTALKGTKCFVQLSRRGLTHTIGKSPSENTSRQAQNQCVPCVIREASSSGCSVYFKSYCFSHIIFIGATCLQSDSPHGRGCLNQAPTLPDWLTFVWYIKFVPSEARNPRLNKSSDVSSVYRHLTGGLANAGRCHLADV